jgi:PIN domain nuclease of toxin-antitoxin system
LLDTHVLIRWRADPRRLSRAQARILIDVARRSETAGVSAISLLEIAMRSGQGSLKVNFSMDEMFATITEHPIFQILPLSVEVAREASTLRNILRDPADCVIVATARVHGLRLLTSDQRIVASNAVSTVD